MAQDASGNSEGYGFIHFDDAAKFAFQQVCSLGTMVLALLSQERTCEGGNEHVGVHTDSVRLKRE